MTISKQKIIIDTDPGVDDALAIHMAFADPRLDVVGLTTIYGNVHTHQATRNACHLVEMAGLTIPVAHGAVKPYKQPQRDPAHFIHGLEGLGDLPAPSPQHLADPRSAAQFICDMANEYGEELIICAIGPLTNLAHALDMDSELQNKIGGVVLMGGAVTVPGNVNAFAEANVHNDPHAAEMVLAAGWDVRIIGLDVTEQILCKSQHLEDIALAAPRIGGFLRDVSAFYVRFYQDDRAFDGCCLHDPAALIAITDPEWFTYRSSGVVVVPEGEAVGDTRMVDEPDRPKVRFAVECKPQLIREHFVATLKSTDQRLAER